MKTYLDGLKYILENGNLREDRTNTGTLSVFGMQERYDLSNNKLPVITTKKIHLKSIIHELIWMLSGDSRVDYLIDNGVTIWNEWVKPETAEYEYFSNEALLELIDGLPKYRMREMDVLGYHLDPNCTESIHAYFRAIFERDVPKRLISGDLGPVYGKQWRNIEDIRIVSEWEDTGTPVGFSESDSTTYLDETTGERIRVYKRKIDQIAELLDNLKNDPYSRRHVISAWHVPHIEEMALPPCHTLFQFYVRDDKETGRKKLSCHLYMRSNDNFLGKPFNITFYSILTHAIANQLDMDADEFIWSAGDSHIYSNHMDQVKLQLSREPYEQPTIEFSKKGKSILELDYNDIKINNYTSHDKITAPVAV